MRQRQVIVVGAGASGLVAAISAARAGANVTLIEQKNCLGKKILSTGNGRCNLTNENMPMDAFRGDDLSVVTPILEQFGYAETISFFESLGLLTKNRDGYIYPISDQASTVLELLKMEVERLNIHVLLTTKVEAIAPNRNGFSIQTDKQKLCADSIILATGGRAASVLGSDGSGYTLAKSMGHSISPVVPALVQLKGKGNYFKQIAGVRTNAKVSVLIDGKFCAEDTGELQLTNYGISGIPVFQISRYAAKALYEKKAVCVEVDFLPNLSKPALERLLKQRITQHGDKTLEQFFIGMLHQKLIGMFLKQAHLSPYTLAQDVPDTGWDALIDLLKHFQIEITETNSFEQAQVCAGGVRTCEINPQTMESLIIDNLYLTGELLDIDGICGGYNLQWAWSTGFIAGAYAGKGLK